MGEGFAEVSKCMMEENNFSLIVIPNQTLEGVVRKEMCNYTLVDIISNDIH
ncbi:hypothetical protein ABVC71_06715 [Prevotella amnii]|uniref:hypothetical protein n=1 Tax=Prevotella amnii TaxID=419005 RepID=UPI00336A37D0